MTHSIPNVFIPIGLTLPELEEWKERWAIMCEDGGVSEEEAKERAYDLVLARRAIAKGMG